MERQKSNLLNKIKHFYESKYKVLLIIPILLFILSLAQITYQTISTGDFVNKGITLKGGISVSVLEKADIKDIEGFLKQKFPDADISIRSLNSAGRNIGFVVEASDTGHDELLDALSEKVKLTKENYTIEETGASLGESFFRETFKALIFAFILMAIIVFIYFRTFIPSLAVILAAFSDIIGTVAVINILGIKLSTGGIAALLMLIGYSVDTDILLSTRVLKRTEGTIMERIYSSIKTGMTMTITTIVAVIAALAFAESPIIKQIMLILLIGLIFDVINTWIQNVGILRLYLDYKRKKQHNE